MFGNLILRRSGRKGLVPRELPCVRPAANLQSPLAGGKPPRENPRVAPWDQCLGPTGDGSGRPCCATTGPRGVPGGRWQKGRGGVVGSKAVFVTSVVSHGVFAL